MAFLLVFAFAVLAIAWLAGEPWLHERRRKRLRGRPFPAQWRGILRRSVPIYRRLPSLLQQRLREDIQVFVAEKDFIGCAGQEIDDEVRVTIAAQACLLTLNRAERSIPSLHTLLVYPGAFVVERLRPEPSGVLQETRQVLSGESWTLGQVVLSWEDVLAGAADPDDGRNVVIHEIAHQLDQEKGFANGAPMLERRRYARWAEVMRAEFERLRTRAVLGEPTLLDFYGATDPAEFFAVASEAFFEQPGRLSAEHPALYQELGSYYQLDPVLWVEHGRAA